MSQDYRLAKLYEQIYNKQSKPAKKENNPKSLNEAYNSILFERTAFYAKEMDAGQEEQPEIAGLDSLGTVPQAEKIKYLIASQSAKPLVNDLMLAAGNWTKADNYQEDLLAPISTEFFAAGLRATEIQKLIEYKSSLTVFSEKVATEQFFNTMSDAVVPNLQNMFPEVDKQKLEELYKYCFVKRCKINDVAVGVGEIALSLFTNCKKGVVGDLDSPTLGQLRLKLTENELQNPLTLIPITKIR